MLLPNWNIGGPDELGTAPTAPKFGGLVGPANVGALAASTPKAGGLAALPNAGGLAELAPNAEELLAPWPNWKAGALLPAVLPFPNDGVPNEGVCEEPNPLVPALPKLGAATALLEVPNEGVVPCIAKAFVPLLALFSGAPKLRLLGEVVPKILDDPNGEAGFVAAVEKLGGGLPKAAVVVVVVVPNPP